MKVPYIYEGCPKSNCSKICYAPYVNDFIWVSFYTHCTSCKSNGQWMHEYTASKMELPACEYASCEVQSVIRFLHAAAGACRQPPFLIYDSKWAQSFVHDCIRLFCLYTSHFSSSPRGGTWVRAIPLSLILDSKIDSIICILFVHDCIRLFSFEHLLLFFSPWRGGTCYPPLF